MFLQSLTFACMCLTVFCRGTGVVGAITYIHLHLPYSVLQGERCCYSPLHPPASALQCSAGGQVLLQSLTSACICLTVFCMGTGVVITVIYIRLNCLTALCRGRRCCYSPLHPPYSAVQGNKCCYSPLHPPYSAVQGNKCCYSPLHPPTPPLTRTVVQRQIFTPA